MRCTSACISLQYPCIHFQKSFTCLFQTHAFDAVSGVSNEICFIAQPSLMYRNSKTPLTQKPRLKWLYLVSAHRSVRLYPYKYPGNRLYFGLCVDSATENFKEIFSPTISSCSSNDARTGPRGRGDVHGRLLLVDDTLDCCKVTLNTDTASPCDRLLYLLPLVDCRSSWHPAGHYGLNKAPPEAGCGICHRYASHLLQ
jgi:hypothetical protein